MIHPRELKAEQDGEDAGQLKRPERAVEIDQAMAILGRRWAATAAVWLSTSAIALTWFVWAFDIQLQPLPFRSFTPSDDELQHLFENLQNSSWFSASTTCKEFLLEGAAEDPIANVGSRQPDMFEWEGGEWFNPPEVLNSTWFLQQRFLRDGVGLHEATFLVTPDASIEVEWGNPADLVRTFGGRLVLKEFWNSYMGDESYLGYQDLKLLLHGAFVSTGVDRRVCMTGCAFRIDYPDERDCEFVLKMKYPKGFSLATSRVEGELSSARKPGDPLHFPALRVLGPRALTGSEYKFRPEKFLQTALNMSSSNLDNNGNASPEDLVSYLVSSEVEYTARVAPTPTEKSQIREYGKVVVGPFSTPYYPLQEGPSLSSIELMLSFKSVVTRLTTTGRRVLVSASMTVFLSYNNIDYDKAPSVDQQTPFNMEGIWDPISEELCMIGSREDEIFPWKLCLKSVLRRYGSIDSPLEGAVLSGPNFAPLGLLRGGADSYHHYRYTGAAKAEELARRATSPDFEALSDTRWFHPRFPGPSDVPGFCTATENLRLTLSGFDRAILYGADGEVGDVFLDLFKVTFVESCGGPNFDVPGEAPLKAPVEGSYLRVAALLGLVRLSTISQQYVLNDKPAQCHAEGVYEPFTGKMHLVVHQRRSERIDGVTVQHVASPWPLERNGGGDVELVEDSEIYMQLQFPSVDRTIFSADEEALDPSPGYSHQDEYLHRFKVNVRVESLRSQSDPLYFKPLVAKNYPRYKPSLCRVENSVGECLEMDILPSPLGSLGS